MLENVGQLATDKLALHYTVYILYFFFTKRRGLLQWNPNSRSQLSVEMYNVESHAGRKKRELSENPHCVIIKKSHCTVTVLTESTSLPQLHLLWDLRTIRKSSPLLHSRSAYALFRSSSKRGGGKPKGVWDGMLGLLEEAHPCSAEIRNVLKVSITWTLNTQTCTFV